MTGRTSATQRGYDARWRRRRTNYLKHHPTCNLCPEPATVPDHWPRSRRELKAAGVTDPDADKYLRPLCAPCHNRETAKHQPGGWATRALRRRPTPAHPGHAPALGGTPQPPNPDDRGA